MRRRGIVFFMADPEHLAILKQGIETWNKWRHDSRDVRPELFGANLPGVDFHCANLEGANIGCANLRSANLSKANLSGADLGGDHHSIRATHGGTDLREANLTGAHLFETSFHGSDLRGATLRRTHMHGTSFVATQLAGADLTDSRLSFAAFHSIDLSEVRSTPPCTAARRLRSPPSRRGGHRSTGSTPNWGS